MVVFFVCGPKYIKNDYLERSFNVLYNITDFQEIWRLCDKQYYHMAITELNHKKGGIKIAEVNS